MSTVTYELKHPIVTTTRVVGKDDRQETITSLEVRRPRAKDLMVLDSLSGEANKSLTLICRLTGLLKVQADELDAEDFSELSGLIADFFPSGPQTGGTSSAT